MTGQAPSLFTVFRCFYAKSSDYSWQVCFTYNSCMTKHKAKKIK